MIMVSLRSRSRTVHEERQPEQEYIAAACATAIANATTAEGDSRSLTVWRKSLLFSCTGFTVIDSCGDLVYRVDNYIGQRPGEVTLMDASGKSVLTVRRRKVILISVQDRLSLSIFHVIFFQNVWKGLVNHR